MGQGAPITLVECYRDRFGIPDPFDGDGFQFRLVLHPGDEADHAIDVELLVRFDILVHDVQQPPIGLVVDVSRIQLDGVVDDTLSDVGQ